MAETIPPSTISKDGTVQIATNTMRHFQPKGRKVHKTKTKRPQNPSGVDAQGKPYTPPTSIVLGEMPADVKADIEKAMREHGLIQ